MSAPATTEQNRTAPASSASHVTNAWSIVTLREVIVKIRDRGFIISTLVTLLLIAGGMGASAFIENQSQSFTVAVVSPQAGQIVQGTGSDQSGEGGLTVDTMETETAEAARSAVDAEQADVALLNSEDGWTLVGKDSVDDGLSTAVGQSLSDYVLQMNAQAAGTTAEDLTAGSELDEEVLQGSMDDEALHGIVSFVFSFLFYMSAIIFGMAIAQSVLEEKQNRVVEILATAIPIRQLLYGKVIGNTILAMAQLALYGGAALVMVNLLGDTTMVGSIIAASGWFFVYFLIGFLILAAGFAVVGSLASRQEDLQSSTTPVMAVIFAALFAGIFAEGTWLTVASYVPVVSSVAMPVRLLEGNVALWEPLLSIVVALLAAVVLIRLGEKIYQRAVLQSGGALSLRKAMRIEE
ncbi:ABC transporter permease [Arthrobacter castelli]|uniref:ABC transporter permease n=1 Tax=Arthrobacter castelli TaxID=271431 RepID=UPI000400A33D|nr:ABC transporter permease [Arthrobacter castelli]